MTDRRISHVKGKGSLNHNNRNYFYKNVDPSRTPNNVCYVKESLTEAYQKCFRQALADYNAKQKRADRKIDDYYTHLQIEGKIALEKRINAMIDGIKETTLFGKTTTTIKFDGTAEQVMTVFNAAKDRDNAKKAKGKAVVDKDKAVKEKVEAVKAKTLAEKQKADMERKAATSEATAASEIKKANTLKSEAAAEIKKAKDLYSQQAKLNGLYHQALSDRDSYKVKADKADKLADELTALTAV